MYFLGIDAGGTKTHCMIADEKRRVIGEAVAGAAQHQIYGIEQTRQSLMEAISAALNGAGITIADITYGVFGMSGADAEEDFALLLPVVRKIMGEIPFQIVHDAWIGFYSATDEAAGVASICGTGAGHVGVNRQGQRLALRNLDYRLGNYGGGTDLAEKALHFAFRSEEGTWDKSLLEEMVPPVFGVESMEEVCAILQSGDWTKEQKFALPIAAFRTAEMGDKVAQEMIGDMGYQEGRYAAAVIRRLEMQKENIPVVLIGSLFRTKSAYLLEPYMRAVHAVCPGAYVLVPDAPPVTGAIQLAIRQAKGETDAICPAIRQAKGETEE